MSKQQETKAEEKMGCFYLFLIFLVIVLAKIVWLLINEK